MYAEVFLGLSTSIQYVLLRAIHRMTLLPFSSWRLILAAVTSSFMALWLIQTVFAIPLSFLCLLILSFGLDKQKWKKGFLLLITTTFVSGGFLYTIQPLLNRLSTLYTFVLLFSLFAILLIQRIVSLDFQKQALNHLCTYEVDIEFPSSNVCCNAYVDTGNLCEEPFSKLPVHFLRGAEKLPFFHPEIDEYPHSIKKGIRPIAFQTIDGTSDEGFAFYVPSIRIHDAKGEKRIGPSYIMCVNSNKAFPNDCDLLLHASTLYI